MRPVCYACRVEMRCHKNGQAVVNGGSLWHGDVYRCPLCGVQVVVGFGREPISEEWRPDYGATVANEAQYGPVLDVGES